MKINKELLIGLVGDYENSDEYKIVYQKISDTGRWSIYYDCVILEKKTGKFYDASYSIGATEIQDESPFECVDEDENGCIELAIELEPYNEMVTKYKRK